MLTEDQHDLAVAAAKRELRSSSDLWSMLRTQLSQHFGGSKKCLQKHSLSRSPAKALELSRVLL